MSPFVRRSSAVAACALASLLLAGAPASAKPGRSAASAVGAGVAVDVSRLRALGLGPTADLLQAALADGLRGFVAPAGGRLVVRLTGFSMNAFAGDADGAGSGGGTGGGSAGGSNNDYLEGEVLVLGPGGAIVSQRPLLSVLPANSGGAYYQPDAERRRVINIAQTFAAWVRRGLI